MKIDEIVNILATLIIPALLAVVIPPLRQYINAKIAAVQHEQLRTWIYDLVLAAEQQFTGIADDETKLAYVSQHAQVMAQQLGLNLSYPQVQALIEATVKAVKGSGGPVAVVGGSGG